MFFIINDLILLINYEAIVGGYKDINVEINLFVTLTLLNNLVVTLVISDILFAGDIPTLINTL